MLIAIITVLTLTSLLVWGSFVYIGRRTNETLGILEKLAIQVTRLEQLVRIELDSEYEHEEDEEGLHGQLNRIEHNLVQLSYQVARARRKPRKKRGAKSIEAGSTRFELMLDEGPKPS